MLTKKCFVCGKKLVKNQRVFCSRSCLYSHQDKRVEIKCEMCGRVGKWRRRFCSHACYSKSLIGKKASKKQLESLKVGWYRTGALTKEHIESIKRSSSWRGVFGKGTPNWRGGRTSLIASVRTTSKNLEWRRKILERDGGKCVKCNKELSNEVHHIKPFRKILEDNNVKTLMQALKCEELWDIDNGQTLCLSCHKQTDSYLVNQRKKTKTYLS